MRICSGAGCLAKVPENVRYCEACTVTDVRTNDGIRVHALVTADAKRYVFLYNTQRWHQLARLILRRDPICKRCDVTLSELADHVIPAGVAIAQCKASRRWPLDTYAGFYLSSNLQGLCRKCHGIKTIEDKTHEGNWPDVLVTYDAQPKRTYLF